MDQKHVQMGSKITSILSALPPDQPFYTFEVFPPKTTPGTTNLISRLSRMASLNPSWIHITWGAGGSTQSRSLELACATRQLGLQVCLHLTCTNMDRSILDRTLERAKELGVVNLLALRGDPPRGEEYGSSTASASNGEGEFRHATDLVKYIQAKHPGVFCIGVAGYPEGHADSENKEADVEYLWDKQEAGAEFVVTQLFYDVEAFRGWYARCRARGITIPILPGIMPIQNFQSFRRMTNLCKSYIPPAILSDLSQIQHDDAAVKAYGVNLAVEMMKQLKDTEGVRGWHLCTLNLEKSVSSVLDKLGWVERPQLENAKKDTVILFTSPPSVNGNLSHLKPAPTPCSDAVAATPSTAPAQHTPTSWDEFPNGRFGDARSPAYGEMDGYGVGLKLPPAEALKLWGYPTTLSDVSSLFHSFLTGTLSSIPWSEEPLRAETTSISLPLQSLTTSLHWWSVGSQPAVDGVRSTDPTYGFGPKGGWVYQKAFVEFFLDEAELAEFERRVEGLQGDEEGEIKWFAGNGMGEMRGNIKTGEGEVNAVTWGVFPGKEIVTTTLIEEMSFKAWNEEAFGIWKEWSYLYPPQSPSRKFLTHLAETRWLISVCHHDYKTEDALWKWLLGFIPAK